MSRSERARLRSRSRLQLVGFTVLKHKRQGGVVSELVWLPAGFAVLFNRPPGVTFVQVNATGGPSFLFSFSVWGLAQ